MIQNRTAFIELQFMLMVKKRYIVLPKTAKVGDKFIISQDAPIAEGNRTILIKNPCWYFYSQC